MGKLRPQLNSPFGQAVVSATAAPLLLQTQHWLPNEVEDQATLPHHHSCPAGGWG